MLEVVDELLVKDDVCWSCEVVQPIEVGLFPGFEFVGDELLPVWKKNTNV